jgi:hypothetical protein
MAKKRTKAEREAWHARVMADVQRLRELAEKGQAELDRRRAEPER